jgi:hypothetical protein
LISNIIKIICLIILYCTFIYQITHFILNYIAIKKYKKSTEGIVVGYIETFDKKHLNLYIPLIEYKDDNNNILRSLAPDLAEAYAPKFGQPKFIIYYYQNNKKVITDSRYNRIKNDMKTHIGRLIYNGGAIIYAIYIIIQG